MIDGGMVDLRADDSVNTVDVFLVLKKKAHCASSQILAWLKFTLSTLVIPTPTAW